MREAREIKGAEVFLPPIPLFLVLSFFFCILRIGQGMEERGYHCKGALNQ